MPKARRPPSSPGDDELPEAGALPPGYRLPFLKNTNFTGRQAGLLELWRLLKPGGAAGGAVAIAAAAGMGGIGKTQLAVEFCHRYGRFYAGVHWLAADQNLEAEIAACGFAMGLQPWPETQAEQVRDTLLAWQSGGRRLVVLDNVADEAVIETWPARLGNASILFTIPAGGMGGGSGGERCSAWTCWSAARAWGCCASWLPG